RSRWTTTTSSPSCTRISSRRRQRSTSRQGRRAVGEAARRELMAPAARLRPRRWSLFGVVSEERYELEQAWAALADRERLLNETLARRSAEIDARARRYEEIGAALDVRRRLIEESEEELRTRERRVTLAEEELRDRQAQIERAATETERLRERAREL